MGLPFKAHVEEAPQHLRGLLDVETFVPSTAHGLVEGVLERDGLVVALLGPIEEP